MAINKLRIGIIDSGVTGTFKPSQYKQRGFYWNKNTISQKISSGDALGHGSALVESILSHAPKVKIVMAQVFHQKLVTTPAQIAAAIDWLISEKVSVINMSFGLPSDRQVIRLACQKAATANIVLVASSPARGQAVYPATYPEVLSATGDARCAQNEFSWLNTHQVDFGAYVKSTSQHVAGASVGCAHVTGHIANYLQHSPYYERKDMLEWLKEKAKYWGAEDRFELRRISTEPLNKDMIFK